ncbi:glycosyltransferase family 9 protein [Campylobacter sp. US33a]|uniref:glycosyltransferase family 9 protein n=1 Tax=Campylobacter sp. US33a TaxID=2498120 RepID=UPI00106813D2|nr:hypothetical protein [Campylobacter sp. US33a]TEY02032.1 hypothetical protein ELQ16_06670 [Campylobacter sp. US33a]
MVASLDMLYAIKTIFKAKLVVFGAKNTQKLLQNFDFIDNFELISSSAKENYPQIIKQINAHHCDYLIAFHSKSFLIKFLLQSNAKRIIIRLKWLSFLNFRCITINDSFIKKFFKDKTIRAKMLYYARKINPKLYDKKINTLTFNNQIPIPLKNKNIIKEFLMSHNLKEKDFLIINPFAITTPYNLSINCYIKLICKASLKYKIVIPTFEAVHQNFIDNLNSFKNADKNQIYIFKNDDDILNLLALLYFSKCLISPSTGTIHLASNIKIPSIGLYLYKDDLYWKTFNQNYVFISKKQSDLSKSESEEIIEEVLKRLDELMSD